MEINIEALAKIIQDGDQMLLSPEGEEVLVKFKEIEAQVEEAGKQIRAKIEETAKKLDPNFKTISGDKIRISYVERGAKYVIDESQIKSVPKEFYETKVAYSVKTTEVDKFLKKTGGLPLGINSPERIKSLTIADKKAKE